MAVQNRDSVVDGQVFVAPGGKTMVCKIVEGIRFYCVGDVKSTSPSKAAVVANGGSGSYNGWVYWTEAEVAASKAAAKAVVADRKPGAVSVKGGASSASGPLYEFLASGDSGEALVESIVGEVGDDADVVAAAKFVAESLGMLKVGMASLAAARSAAVVRASAEVERARAAAIAAECEAANLAQAELVAAYEAGQSAEVAAAVIEGSGVKVGGGRRK